MNSELILQSDVLDILFDKRNKLYGAYSLRKFYPNRVKTSLLIMLGGVALLSAFTLMPTKKITPPEVYITTAAHIFSEANPPKKQASPKQKTKTLSASQKFISKLTIVTEKDSTDFLNDLSKLAIAGKTTLLAGGTPPFESGPQGGEDVGRKAATIAPIIDYSKPLNNPDVQASFPGGNAALIRFLEQNLQSPGNMEEGQMVQVKVKFVVSFDGNLQSFDVVQDGGEAYNNEVIRVLKKMPKWLPGKMGTPEL